MNPVGHFALPREEFDRIGRSGQAAFGWELAASRKG